MRAAVVFLDFAENSAYLTVYIFSSELTYFLAHLNILLLLLFLSYFGEFVNFSKLYEKKNF